MGGGINPFGGKTRRTKLVPEEDVALEPPKESDTEIQDVAAKERRLMRFRRGRQSTMLSNLRQDRERLG
jgi:hypothetical protein